MDAGSVMQPFTLPSVGLEQLAEVPLRYQGHILSLGFHLALFPRSPLRCSHSHPTFLHAAARWEIAPPSALQPCIPTQ